MLDNNTSKGQGKNKLYLVLIFILTMTLILIILTFHPGELSAFYAQEDIIMAPPVFKGNDLNKTAAWPGENFEMVPSDEDNEYFFMVTSSDDVEIIFSGQSNALTIFSSGGVSYASATAYFDVISGSGEVEITAFVRDGYDDQDILSSITEVFQVSEAHRYELHIIFAWGYNLGHLFLSSPNETSSSPADYVVWHSSVGPLTNMYIAGSGVPLHTLSVNSTNPSVAVNIASSTGHMGTTSYSLMIRDNLEVNLEAPRYHGWSDSRKRFDRWTGGVSTIDRNVTFIINEGKTFTANYVDAPADPPPSSTGYGWLLHEQGSGLPIGPVTIGLPSGVPGSISAINDFFISGADFVENILYGISYEIDESAKIYTIDINTGNLSLVGSTGFNQATTGLAYDSSEGALYATIYDNGWCKLYTIDINTGDASLVDTIYHDHEFRGIKYRSPKQMAGIAIDNNGNMYGICYISGSLYSIDKTTADATMIGPLGVNISYAQDIAYDRDNGILYGTLFVDKGGIWEGGLYYIDANSGSATLINAFNNQEIAGFAIPYLGESESCIISVDVVGEGIVRIDGREVTLPLNARYLEGTEIELEAIASADWRFVEWAGSETGTSASASLTMDLDKSVTAVFEPDDTATFIDVPSDHPFFAEIEKLVALGITTGWPDGTFRPTLPVTRMAMAAFLFRAFDLQVPDITDPTFLDVDEDHPFFEEIEALAASGITTGWPDGTFRPDLSVTRMATAAFLYRALGLADLGVTVPTFSDVPTGHPYFKEIEALAAAGITTGWPDGTFRPDLSVTRQAIAALLIRALELDD